MGSSQRVVSGIYWSSLVTIINIVYGFISVPILLNYFGKGQYGLIGLACSVNAYMQLIDMGLNSTNVRFFSSWLANNNQEKIKKGVQTSLSFYSIVGIINALILVIISVFSASIFNVTTEQDVTLKHLLYVIVFTSMVGWISSCLDQIVRATENVAWTQKRAMIPKTVQILTLVVTVVFKLDILTYFILSSLSFLITMPLTINKIRKEVPFISFYPKFYWDTFREILPYSINIFSFSIFQFSFNNLRPVFLGIQGTVESVADYNVLMGIVSAVTLVPNTFISSLIPSTSRVVAQNNKDAFYKVAYDGTKYVSIVMCFCCFGMMVLGRDLIFIYVGDKFLYLMPWLYMMLIIIVFGHNQAISSLILAGDNLRPITYSSMCASIIGLLTTWFFIPNFLVGGTVIGLAIYQVVQVGFYYFYYWPRKMNINSKKVFYTCFAPYAIIGIVCYLICYFIPLGSTHVWNILAYGSIFTFLFSFFTYITFTKNDKLFFKSLIPSIRLNKLLRVVISS